MLSSGKGLEKFHSLIEASHYIGKEFESEFIKIKYYKCGIQCEYLQCDNILLLYSEISKNPLGERKQIFSFYIDIWKNKLVLGSYTDPKFNLELISSTDILDDIEEDQFFQISLLYDLSHISIDDINYLIQLSRKTLL